MGAGVSITFASDTEVDLRMAGVARMGDVSEADVRDAEVAREVRRDAMGVRMEARASGDIERVGAWDCFVAGEYSRILVAALRRTLGSIESAEVARASRARGVRERRRDEASVRGSVGSRGRRRSAEEGAALTGASDKSRESRDGGRAVSLLIRVV